MELYFKLRIIVEFIVPALILIIFLLVLLSSAWKYYKIDKIRKYMKSNGYCYYLRENASYEDKLCWVYQKGNIIVNEDGLYKMSFSKIKNTY